MGRTHWKVEHDKVKRELNGEKKRVEELEPKVASLNDKISSQQQEHAEKIAEKDKDIEIARNESSQLKQELETAKDTLQSAKEELRKKELNRFANEYKNEEVRYEREQSHWFWYSLLAGAGVVSIAFLTAINYFEGSGDIPKVEVVFLNAVALTVFIYSLKQHSHLADLREDYANRKALAQSYQYMVDDEDGSLGGIKDKFFEKAIESFTRKPKGRGSDVTWYETMASKYFRPKT